MAEHLASELPEDEASELASEQLAPGTRLGRYELLVPIAKGGMARVWAARQHGHRGFTKLCAVKTILPHLARDEEFERMFLDEARIASLVQHPNVCTIYELGEEGSVLYLAMEWVQGSSLAHLLRPAGPRRGNDVAPIKAEPMDVRFVARIVSDACAGLHAAHVLTDDDGQALGVVHRDVSPHNILVSADGNVKVADFGVAKALGQTHSATTAGQLKGKLNYMAPEQVTGGQLDRRSDLFSLGCVLYEATTGEQPFKADGDHQVMHRLLKGDFQPPSKLIKGYPDELEKIVARAMAPQPLLRFHTAELMRHALEEWLAKSGPIVTEAQIAGAVKTRVGAVLDSRRERIRAASANTSDRAERGSDTPPMEGMTPSGRGRSSSGVKSSGKLSERPSRPLLAAASLPIAAESLKAPIVIGESEPDLAADLGADERQDNDTERVILPPASTSRYALAAVLGIVGASAIAAIGFFVWRASSTPPPTARVAPNAVTPISSIVAEPARREAAQAGAHLSSSVSFTLMPDSAILVVNGVEMPPGTRSVARPAVGQTLDVAVRAPNHQEQKLIIDDAVPSPVEIVLSAASAAAVPSAGPPPVQMPPPVQVPPRKELRNEPAEAKPPKPEAIPANPY